MDNIFSNAQRAEVLTAALPYIRRYNGKCVVVKYGGNAMINQQLKEQVMEDIVLLWLIGVKVVLVHGGGPEISESSKLLSNSLYSDISFSYSIFVFNTKFFAVPYPSFP